MPETVDSLRRLGRSQCEQHGIERREIDLLLAHVLEKPLAWLFAHGDDEVPSELSAAAQSIFTRRAAGAPLQYLIGSTEFFGREFIVDERVLIPRPETELLVEETLRVCPPDARIIDVGTGSGCIAVTLDLELQGARVVAIDRSLDAVVVARENARRLGAKVSFVQGDVLLPLHGKYDLVVSNPPYISSDGIASLQREVQQEPHLALSPGADALVIIRRLFEEAVDFVAPGGTMLLEIGYRQAVEVRSIAAGCGWEIVSIVPDLAGIERVVIAKRATGSHLSADGEATAEK